MKSPKNPDQAFESFWRDLISQCRDYRRLGAQRRAGSLKPCAEVVKPVSQSRPCDDLERNGLAPDSVRICPGNNAEGGLIITGRGNRIAFRKDLAEATWHRYHGLRSTALRFKKIDKMALPNELPHRMTSSYIKPGQPGYPQNWIDCPQPIRAPAFVAAAIHCYCQSHPNLGFQAPI